MSQTIDMILYCPNCGMQHIDAPETTWKEALEATGRPVPPEAEEAHAQKWTNPPHRSHLCHGCKCVWRPADVPTNGVAELKTRGNADTWPAIHNEEVHAMRAHGVRVPDGGQR